MLRTSLRTGVILGELFALSFLSSNAQDFIEDDFRIWTRLQWWSFLSSNAQDFIEDAYNDSQTALTQYS